MSEYLSGFRYELLKMNIDNVQFLGLKDFRKKREESNFPDIRWVTVVHQGFKSGDTWFVLVDQKHLKEA